MEHIQKLEPEEAEQILRLPNSYFDRGFKKGMEEGIEKGVSKVAVKMLQKRMDVNMIAEITGLSLEEVLKLKQQFGD